MDSALRVQRGRRQAARHLYARRRGVVVVDEDRQQTVSKGSSWKPCTSSPVSGTRRKGASGNQGAWHAPDATRSPRHDRRASMVDNGDELEGDEDDDESERDATLR